MAGVQQWETLVELVERMDGSDAASTQTHNDLLDLLDALAEQPPLPRALWKKLLQQKVPLRLLEACAQHMQSLQTATTLAAHAATMLFTAAYTAGVLQTRGDRTATSIGASLLLQLRQSGLLEALPAMLAAASQRLQRAVVAAKGGLIDEDAHRASQQAMLSQLLSLACKLLLLRPEQDDGVALVPLPAVAGLMLNSWQYLTCNAAILAAQKQEQQQQQQEEQQEQQQQQGEWQAETQCLFLSIINGARHSLLLNLMVTLDAFVSRPASCSSSSRAAAAADAAVQMLRSEECLVCLAMVVLGDALPLTQQQLEGGSNSDSSSGSSGSSSGSSSGGCGSNSCGGEASTQAEQQPHEQGAGWPPPQLPMQLMAVLQHAGCSADAVYVCSKSDPTFADVDHTLTFLAVYAAAQRKVSRMFPALQEQLGRLAVLHKLLGSALLQLAHMLARPSVPHMDVCSKCCATALLLRQHARYLQLQAQSHSSCSICNSGNPSNSSAHGQHTSQPQQQGDLQLVLDLLEQLLQLWPSTTAALTAADAPIGLGLPESSSSSSNTDQAAVPAVLQGADGPVVVRCISRTINVLSAALLPVLCHQHKAERPAAGDSGQQQQQVLTAVRLCSLLSQQARMSIEAVQLSGSSSTAALRQSGHVLTTTLQAAASDLLHALHGIANCNEVWEHLNCTTDVSFHPSSTQRQHLLDLLFNLLKVASIDSATLQQQPGFSVAGILRLICGVVCAACARVAGEANDIMAHCAAAAAAAAPPAPCADPQTAAAAAAAADSHAGTVTASDAAAEASQQDTAAAAAAACSSARCPDPTAMLPWLVLLGRCCLLWARWLQQLSVAEEVTSGQQQQGTNPVINRRWDVAHAAAAAADPWSMLLGQFYIKSLPASKLHCVTAGCGGTKGLSAAICNTALSAGAWLGAGSNMQQLANLGYNNLQPLQAALLQLRTDANVTAAAVHTIAQQPLRTGAERAAAEAFFIAERTTVIGLCPQLQAVGEALTAFAFPLACNNPSCVNASGPSEARLVGGKACVCAGCLTARYCSRACLKQHWKVHKPVCKALAAAAARAAGSPAAAAVDTHASG